MRRVRVIDGGQTLALRLQKGLSRTAFEPAVAAKTVARIESNAIGKQRGKTLAAIAKKLGLAADAIAS